MKGLSYIRSALSEVLFPAVCMLCGMPLSGKQQYLCGDCLSHRFEEAHVKPEDRLNLPESVKWRTALWDFDKGGYLQDLLHELKYKGLSSLGEDLGAALGNRLKRIHDREWEEVFLLPVPLHLRKKRKRGFNQSYHIALGVQRLLKCEILREEVVLRVRQTRSQTGFNLEKRRSNVYGAFEIRDAGKLSGKEILIVDDVFTTGATTFELARVLQEAGADAIYITTVAQA